MSGSACGSGGGEASDGGGEDAGCEGVGVGGRGCVGGGAGAGGKFLVGGKLRLAGNTGTGGGEAEGNGYVAFGVGSITDAAIEGVIDARDDVERAYNIALASLKGIQSVAEALPLVSSLSPVVSGVAVIVRCCQRVRVHK